MTTTLLCALAALSAEPPRNPVYDVYFSGVRVAEVTVQGAAGSRVYTIRKRSFWTTTWTEPHRVSESGLAADSAFQLMGSIRPLVARLTSGQATPWSQVELVGWPDKSSIYLKHRELNETVNGRAVRAWHWAQKDASRPLDLVIGQDNRLIAGFDPGIDAVLVERGFEAFTTVARWRKPNVSQPTFGVHANGKEMVPMTDGIKLSTLVYLPTNANQQKFPTVFIRTPYGIGGLINGFWPYVARGYALVVQSTRGTFHGDMENHSEGQWDDVINEPADGKASLEWLVKQPWSDGNVCMQGGSFVGYTQWAVAMSRNPALKCIIPESSMGTSWSDQPYWRGGYVEGGLYYSLFMLNVKTLPGRTWTDILHHRPLIDMDNFATGQNIESWDVQMRHWTNDDYWARQDWYRGDHPRNFSSLQISGWWDDDFPGTQANWAMMQRYGRGSQRLVIGPWKHGYNVDRSLNGYPYGVDAIRDDVPLLKQLWYDKFLKGIDNGVDSPAVSYFVLGANEWRTATAWPPKEASPTPWYLRSDGRAAQLATGGSLTKDPPSGAEPADVYRYDPANPPPNWMSFDQMLRWEDVQVFPHDFKDIEARPDVATYTSAPLDADLTIAGDVMVSLYASTDVKDTDWWVHLSDVDEAGRSNRISIGLIRARFRNNEDKVHHALGNNYRREELLTGDPSAVVRYDISLRSIANRFAKGHRIRIAVMNAVDNYEFPNSNTGGDEATVTTTVVGTMQIHHRADYPSKVVLPVIR